ncbi:MAG: TIGR02266 family protein [Deltaproteobacteria bacterium]|nr:TIGR02266 family protein [Deltaproteobacteria bacterium]
MSDDDRRNSPRAPIELKVEYRRLNTFFADYTRNISRGGTFIKTETPLDIDTEFVFKLKIPSLVDPITLKGKVKWVVSPQNASSESPAGMGIKFIYASQEEKELIESKVERLMIDSLGQHLYHKLLKKKSTPPAS